MVCPAGYMAKERTEACAEVLLQWGFKLSYGKTIGSQVHYFSGTDDERLADLQDMIDNPEINAVLCARGGYGTSRIMDRINWSAFRKKPKWIIGYSDITAIHCHLERKLNTASLHAPMAGAFADAQGIDEFNSTLEKALKGRKLRYHSPAYGLNRTGKAEGKLIGGNLSLLAHLVGTTSMPSTDGAILFVEEIGEYLYHVDRMLLQLDRAGKLANLGGIIFGGFTEMKDTVTPFGETLEAILYAHVKKYNFPVAFQFPVGHARENVALRVGMPHTLSVTTKGATLISSP